MLIREPVYHQDYQCLAGDCPHTCCALWEVPVDPDTAGYYRTLPGELGDRLRAALRTDEEGENCFQLRGGTCPFLDGEGLCEIHRRLGQERTGLICRTHPRFQNDFGFLRERGLCASCPACAALVLSHDLNFLEWEDGTAPEEAAPELLGPLLEARDTAFFLLRQRRFSVARRLQALLLFANEVQVLLDQEEGSVHELCTVYREEFPLLEESGSSPRQEVRSRAVSLLKRLEPLQPGWRGELDALAERLERGGDFPAQDPEALERTACYFLYRHWLRGVWDGDVLSWAELTVLSAAVTALLAGEDYPGALRRYCLEIEHSQPNLEALQDAFWDEFSLSELLVLAGGVS